MVTVKIDGIALEVPAGTTILRASDQAGRYVPRLCYCPSLRSCSRCLSSEDMDAAFRETGGLGPDGGGASKERWATDRAPAGPGSCGLCLVRVGAESGELVLACATPVRPGLEITTDDEELRLLRQERLAPLLARHPHVCLDCPDRDGCAREECRFHVPVEARCCDQLGRCEFGRLVGYIDPERRLARRAVAAPRAATKEGPIRREPGLCVGCGRCVVVCSTSSEAADVLELREENGSWTAWPRQGGLRDSGCSFCGQCVLVCPAGAITAPGPEGGAWLEGRRKRYPHLAPVLPPLPWLRLAPLTVAAVPAEPGVFQLADASGQVVRISGCADLREGLRQALAVAGETALGFRFELAPLYTERETELLALFAQEHGHLPPQNDLDDDLFADDLF